MLPSHLSARLDASTWPVPPVLHWFKHAGSLSDEEFARTWNTGLGMVIVVPSERAAEATKVLESEGEKVFRVGELVRRRGKRRRGNVDGDGGGDDDEADEERMVKRRKRTGAGVEAGGVVESGREEEGGEDVVNGNNGNDDYADNDDNDEVCMLTNVHVWN